MSPISRRTISADALRGRIAALADADVVALSPLPGGTFGTLWRADLADGRRLVAKSSAKSFGAPGGTLETEGWMLSWLAARAALPVPEVVDASPDFLLMTWIPSGGPLDAAAQVHAADLIAALHEVRGETYGFERDTVIGPLVQPNAPDRSWVAFLRDRRLMPMGRDAHAAGRLPDGTLRRLERFCGRLGDFVGEPPFPSLLHGDLWTGNVLCADGRITGFVDPALYFGDPEMDLAFSTLFGTFGEPFFARYAEHRPIPPGFTDTRRDICNLWPLLVHARLFGGHYAARADAILRRFV